MSKFKEILKEEFYEKEYHSFLYTTARYDRKPFKLIQFENGSQDCMIIFSYTKTGEVVTRHMNFHKADAVFVRAWLADDFPEMEIDFLEPEEVIEHETIL